MEVTGALGITLLSLHGSRLCSLERGIYFNSYRSQATVWLLTAIVTVSPGKS